MIHLFTEGGGWIRESFQELLAKILGKFQVFTIFSLIFHPMFV